MAVEASPTPRARYKKEQIVQRYVTNPQVIHETIEGETIIIDLATGTYFSLQGSAPVIWNGLAVGASDDEIVSRLETLYGPDPGDRAPTVSAFLEELTAEQLIAPSQNGVAAIGGLVPVEAAAPAAFVPPKLDKFTDMQDIILLDPVHKVDSQGWPHAAPVESETV
jgi:hypothetical protein